MNQYFKILILCFRPLLHPSTTKLKIRHTNHLYFYISITYFFQFLVECSINRFTNMKGEKIKEVDWAPLSCARSRIFIFIYTYKEKHIIWKLKKKTKKKTLAFNINFHKKKRRYIIKSCLAGDDTQFNSNQTLQMTANQICIFFSIFHW